MEFDGVYQIMVFTLYRSANCKCPKCGKIFLCCSLVPFVLYFFDRGHPVVCVLTVIFIKVVKHFFSSSEKVILVLFITLRWNLCGLVVVFIVSCTCFMRSSFLSKCLYVFCICFLMQHGWCRGVNSKHYLIH